MLMIRLQRVGRKHEPVFRLVLTDSKDGPKSGKFLEILGNYDARRGEKAEFKVERVKHWMSKGAQLSDTVHNLMIDRKVIEGKKINALPKKTALVKEKTEEKAPEMPKAEAETPVEETPAKAAPEEIKEEKQEEKTESPEEPTTKVVEEKTL